MDHKPIPEDDLLDVMEMTKKIEEFVYTVLSDNNLNLSMSALMSSCINCMLSQCKTLDEVIFYRHLFVQILDKSIRSIKINDSENSSSD